MVKKIVLDNGLTIVLEDMPFFKSAGIGIWVKAGSAWETEENNGIAHVVEHMVFKGTNKRDGKQIAEDMMALGADIDAYTSRESTCFYTSLLGEYVPEALEIMTDMLINPKIDEEDLEKEKGIICDEIDMYDDDPQEHVHEMLENAIWRESPYGFYISGNKENVNNFTADGIRQYIKEYYTPERTVISICGCFDEEKVVETIKNIYKNVTNGENPKTPEKPEYFKSFVYEVKDIEQVHVDFVFDSVGQFDEDRFALTVINSMLGGNMNARLFRHIREDLGLVYTVYSYTSANIDSGILGVSAAASPENIREVISEIWNITNGFKDNLPDENEFNLVKRVIRSNMIIGSESPRAKMDSNGRLTTLGKDIISLDDRLKILDSVDIDMIEKACKKYFIMDKVSISLSGAIKEEDIEWIKNKFNFS